MRIQHNLSAINSQRNIFATNQTMAKNLEKLSSGYRINRAGDDAALPYPNPCVRRLPG